jgi:energy-coupling factor transporter ATP-binding protein EcfA2
MSNSVTIARIAKIGVSDYRVFPGGPPFEFNLGADGRNLLLFGENGSGKTSLFRALRDLMATQPPPASFEDLRHVFSPGNEGFVSVQLTAGGTNEYRWDYGNPHPRETGGQPYALFAERSRFLDYRSLLETNFVHRATTPNLYRLLVSDVLKDLPVIVNGKQDRLGAWHERMLSAKPRNHRSKYSLQGVDWACARFSEALANHLPEIVKEGNRILCQMGYEKLAFDLKPGTVKYDRNKRNFDGQEIALSVTLYGQPVAHPQLFLNEARLTALALAIYLGSARLILQSPASSSDGTTPVRLLVLDDVLIGLDLANRLPVLKVINEEFGEWQVLLFTYDRVWFDLAREYTEQSHRWTYLTLKEIPGFPGHPGKPLIEPGLDALAIAEKHFPADLVAAAVYLRAAFETRLKNVCRDKGVLIAFKPDPKEVKADKLWHGIKDRQSARQEAKEPDFISPSLIDKVEMVRSNILNRLSHAGAPTFDPSEVKFALDTIKAFCHCQFT